MAWTILPSLVVSPPSFDDNAYAITADGLTVFGEAVDNSGIEQAVAWASGGSVTQLNTALSGNGRALCCSTDGSTVYGFQGSPNLGFVWTSGGGNVNINGTNYTTQVRACSSDGSVGAGILQATSLSLSIAYKYASGTWTSLGTLAGDNTSAAMAITADGLTIFGWSGHTGIDKGFKWTAGGGMVAFTAPPGASSWEIYACSSDGSVVVGRAQVSATDRAWMWTAGGGSTLLPLLPGGSKNGAFAISSNGTTIGGYGDNIDGVSVAVTWVNGVATAYPLVDAGAVDTGILAINNNGTRFSGFSSDDFRNYNAVVWGWPLPSATQPTTTEPLGGWRGLVGINWLGMALVGDAYSGVVGLSNFATFTEYQNPMIMRMTSPPIQNDRKRIFIRKFELDVQAATADATTPDPQLVLEYSKDSGMTWQPLALARSMGEVGQYTKRLRWLNLGESRAWVLRVTISDPVRRTIIGAYIDLAAGVG